ncbi:hypothetical protein RFI_06799 [Reticulomyxa filosa]|uniref:N-acetyltransferase domain-containing protein n=1 Tax=Reticulomyxa filosa TaxID=46433 RepID=X6NVH9_RETFI|nr:hypothetical protein RFI_06799 [Reticulomyxa filosa]|eukprot:ETO30320.1 hypothetical protein RFI_06799 [Reticulomyxa filosa]
MAGDINVFLSCMEIQNYEDTSEAKETKEKGQTQSEQKWVAELNVMIADKKCQRKGLAKESLKLIMDWTIQYLKIDTFIAKIHANNQPSLALFAGLGFKQLEYIPEFEEYTFIHQHITSTSPSS